MESLLSGQCKGGALLWPREKKGAEKWQVEEREEIKETLEAGKEEERREIANLVRRN